MIYLTDPIFHNKVKSLVEGVFQIVENTFRRTGE